ncbi:Predicted membrane protein [[Clostridium] sordellii]|nr:ECF transporter S component [Paeniclostridium sordellii]MCQ4697059.1 ECF transporter S component [Paeniclostridium sordellii]MDU4413403.1 ECF transporter S component [Paeniclostridium sordellii]MDU6481495.1 ECF transporter S component [Paeniclostridium sordellii]CEN83226.1 Predicted membrane protein [[Clostridium] sordellii] [Paeniclostridium sordellii]CEO11274.1 Predicted membrane protein [[Clostridium] sordellii] [Paeniclostridium sordellii]
MKSKKIAFSSMFIAFGIILPMIFHTVNLAGNIFLPMHIPVLIGGFLLGPVCGMLIGIITPVLSGFMTGMPPIIPVMPIMAFELCAYGFLTGYIFNKTKKIYITLFCTMLGGRLFAVIGAYLVSITVAPKVNPLLFVFGNITMAIPGILIQLIFIPIFIKYLNNNLEIRRVLA